ncbi:hypothetical protein AWB74_07307 [Caballeronia arvi]|uniref:Uncharacterized protein n=1 Tax=Caballeronia arvi TaxID=1777135 RepID=A0A158KWG2_9BURK|nr:hypothetical protein AWB74_07307 [Caballeronia arvi]
MYDPETRRRAGKGPTAASLEVVDAASCLRPPSSNSEVVAFNQRRQVIVVLSVVNGLVVGVSQEHLLKMSDRRFVRRPSTAVRQLHRYRHASSARGMRTDSWKECAQVAIDRSQPERGFPRCSMHKQNLAGFGSVATDRCPPTADPKIRSFRAASQWAGPTVADFVRVGPVSGLATRSWNARQSCTTPQIARPLSFVCRSLV